MPTTLNKSAYQKLVKEDLEWLQKQPRSLERDHIEQVLKWSIGQLYQDEIEEMPRCTDQSCPQYGKPHYHLDGNAFIEWS